MKVQQEVIEYVFEDEQFLRMFNMDIKQMLSEGESIEDILPQDWGIRTDSKEMDNEIYYWIKNFKSQKSLFYVSITDQYDSQFSFVYVPKEYKNMLLWTLNHFNVYHDELQNLDPTSFDEFDQQED